MKNDKIQDKTQRQKFIYAAKEHECNESEKVFEGKLKKLSKAESKPVKKGKKD